MRRWFSPGRVALALLLLLILAAGAALLAPEVDAEPLRGPVQRALTRTLGRPVEFRTLEYQVYPSPGLKVLDLVIPEEPQFGREPIAYVTEMQVGLSWRSLFARSLQVSSVRLVDASLNLTLAGESGWNAVRLLRQMAGEVESPHSLPSVELTSCRINFRNGLRKSAYFLNTVELELESSAGGFDWNFEASPARTDRAEQGFGRFTGKGRWRASQSGDGSLDLEIELEPSALTEVTQFLAGRDLGLQGRLASRVRLGGSPRNLTLSGTLELAGLDRPALFGLRQAEAGFPIDGALDVARQTLRLQTKPPKQGQDSPFSVEFDARQIFSQPEWQVSAAFDALPAPAFLDVGRKLGARFPAALAVEGSLSGKVSLSASAGLDGEMTLRDASVRLGDAGPLAAREAQVRLAGSTVRLDDMTVRTAAGHEVTLRGEWSALTESLDFEARSEAIAMDELLAARNSIPESPSLPLLGDCSGGEVGGRIEFHRGPQGEQADPGEWRGEYSLAGVTCPVTGAAQPVLVRRGSLVFRKNGWTARQVQGAWGDLAFTGDAVSQPDARRPFRFTLHMPEAGWRQLEALMEPALLRRRSLLDRTLPFRRSRPPSWLAGRHAEGRVRFDLLRVGDFEWRDVKAVLYWDGLEFEAPQLSGAMRDARLETRLRISLGADQPEYRLIGTLTGWPWLGGELEADFDAQMRGAGSALETSLRASGNFRALRVTLPDSPVRSLEGAYDFDASRRPGRLRLTAVDGLSAAGESWVGQGASSPDGNVTIDFNSPRRGPLRVVWPLQSLVSVAESESPAR